MKESATYQEILREGKAAGRAEGRAEGKAEGKLEGIRKGRIEEAKRLLVRQGQKRFGPPTSSVKAKVESVVNLAKLEKLADKILDVQSWDELIAGI
jgi:predicted transposase YdaD